MFNKEKNIATPAGLLVSQNAITMVKSFIYHETAGQTFLDDETVLKMFDIYEQAKNMKGDKSEGTPEDRAKGLSSATGVPLSFEVHYDVAVDNMEDVEKPLHTILDSHRLNRW